jgi:glycosyltransferase involved in cell wall biosynthesis
MNIALYHPWVYLHSGIERMFVEIVARSRHDWTIYTHHHEPDATYPELREARIVELSPRVSVRRELGPLVRAATTMARCRIPDEHDALLVSSEGLGDLVLTRTRVPAVAYCHTPLKIVHDPVARDRLEDMSRVKASIAGVVGPAFTAVDRRLWRRYRHVFVNSAETGRRAAAAGLVDVGRAEVLHPGVDLARFGAPEGRRERRFLVAGRIMWQKHIDLAIDALRLARTDGLDATMVVAGAVDEKSRPELARLRALAEGLPITFEVDPPDARLAELYRSSLALVFTPPNEDFGMVPLEAMAAGLPVLAVDQGGPRESVVHGSTGWLLANTADAFAEHLRLAASSDLASMRDAARARASAFGWDPFVGRLDDVLERVAQGRAVSIAAAASSQDQIGSAGTASEPDSASIIAPATPVTSPGET